MVQIEKKMITVHGHDFEYAVKGHQSPAVVLINGAGGPIEGWSRIWGELGQENVLFAYNRLGMGKSSKPKEPQTGMTMVKDLKELLMQIRIEPPYILLGHSLGGLIAHLFAVTYPNDVQGLIFLESSTISDVLNDAKRKKESDPTKFSEVDHVPTTIQQIQEAGVFPHIPVFVVGGGKPAFGWMMPKAAKEARLNHQKELVGLSGQGRVTIAKNSGHFPQLTEPCLVVNEITCMIHKVMNLD